VRNDIIILAREETSEQASADRL